jgi:hypothetical protein
MNGSMNVSFKQKKKFTLLLINHLFKFFKILFKLAVLLQKRKNKRVREQKKMQKIKNLQYNNSK